jgi:hypothetical protein
MSYRDEKEIGLSREELAAAKLPFGLGVILIVVAFFGFAGVLAWLITEMAS